MTIDISPEAVENLCNKIDEWWEYQHGHLFTEAASTLRTLSAALSASQAETAAAYEAGRAAGLQEAAKIADECSETAVKKLAETKATGERLVWWIANARSNMARDLILAAIPKGEDHE